MSKLEYARKLGRPTRRILAFYESPRPRAWTHGKSAQPTFCEALDWILSKRRVRTHRRHDPGSDGSVPLVLVGETVVGMQFPSHPHGDADDHGGYLCKDRDLSNTSI